MLNDIDQGSRIRRTSRACLQCRARKQRCHGESEHSSGPCHRCQVAGKVCSFESEKFGHGLPYPPYNPHSSTAKVVERLQTEIAEHKARLEALERALGINGSSPQAGSCDGRSISPNSPSSPFEVTEPPKKRFSMDGVTLGAPIATLRTLASMSDSSEDCSSSKPTRDLENLPDLQSPSRPPAQYKTLRNGSRSTYDPVIRGVLHLEEAQTLFDIFFKHCHSFAPLLCCRTQRDATLVHSVSTLLFTTICSIGARFWSSESWLHPRYAEIVELLDQSLTALLLRPTAADMSVEAVQALLLYVQWMPLDVSPSSSATSPSSSWDASAPPRPRFSDTSAWSVIGLAIRLATYLGLHRAVEAPFNTNEVEDEEMKKMRVWMCLLSIDHHLTVTARLPATLDPAPAAHVARAFASNPRAERSDLKVAGLCELVAVIHRAARFAGDASLRVLDSVSLQKANRELNEWESIWITVLCNANFEHHNTQMPFTALRWYRLALNVVSLGPGFLGNDSDEFQTPCTTTLSAAVDAASSMLYSFTANHGSVSQSSAHPHMASLVVDSGAVTSFRYTIDAYWVTHAFAVVFLAMAYDRGVINDDLSIVLPRSAPILHSQSNLSSHMSYSGLHGPVPAQISLSRGLPHDSPSTKSGTGKLPLRKTSELFHLIQLAADIFDSAASHPPAMHYRAIVRNTQQALMQARIAGSNEGRIVEDLERTQGVGAANGMEASGTGVGVADMFALVVEDGQFPGFEWLLSGSSTPSLPSDGVNHMNMSNVT